MYIETITLSTCPAVTTRESDAPPATFPYYVQNTPEDDAG